MRWASTPNFMVGHLTYFTWNGIYYFRVPNTRVVLNNSVGVTVPTEMHQVAPITNKYRQVAEPHFRTSNLT